MSLNIYELIALQKVPECHLVQNLLDIFPEGLPKKMGHAALDPHAPFFGVEAGGDRNRPLKLPQYGPDADAVRVPAQHITAPRPLHTIDDAGLAKCIEYLLEISHRNLL